MALKFFYAGLCLFALAIGGIRLFIPGRDVNLLNSYIAFAHLFTGLLLGFSIASIRKVRAEISILGGLSLLLFSVLLIIETVCFMVFLIKG